MEKPTRRRSKSFRDDDIVLVKKEVKKQNPEWSHEETQCLLDIYLETKYSFEHCTEMGGIKVSELLAKRNIERSPEEIHRKITHLRKTYHKIHRRNSENDNNEEEDDCGDTEKKKEEEILEEKDQGSKRVENDWPYYKIIGQILEENSHRDDLTKNNDNGGKVDAVVLDDDNDTFVTSISKENNDKASNGDFKKGDKNPRKEGRKFIFFINDNEERLKLDLAAYQLKLLELRNKYEPKFQSLVVPKRSGSSDYPIEVFWRSDSSLPLANTNNVSNVFARFAVKYNRTFAQKWFLSWNPRILPTYQLRKVLSFGSQIPPEFIELSVELQKELIDSYPLIFGLYVHPKNDNNKEDVDTIGYGYYIGNEGFDQKMNFEIPKVEKTVSVAWTHEETQCLIYAFKVLKCNLQNWSEADGYDILKIMAQNNFSRSLSEIQTKAKALREKYRKAVQGNTACLYFLDLQQLCVPPKQLTRRRKKKNSKPV